MAEMLFIIGKMATERLPVKRENFVNCAFTPFAVAALHQIRWGHIVVSVHCLREIGHVIDAFGHSPRDLVDRDEAILAALSNLTKAIEGLTAASVRQVQLFEVLLEAMPAATEARILGISERTIRRRRKTRQLARLVEAA